MLVRDCPGLVIHSLDPQNINAPIVESRVKPALIKILNTKVNKESLEEEPAQLLIDALNYAVLNPPDQRTKDYKMRGLRQTLGVGEGYIILGTLPSDGAAVASSARGQIPVPVHHRPGAASSRGVEGLPEISGAQSGKLEQMQAAIIGLEQTLQKINGRLEDQGNAIEQLQTLVQRAVLRSRR